MTRRTILFLLAAALLALPPVADAIEGYPGSTWGKLTSEFPEDGENNTILEGWVRQGITWKRWRMEPLDFQFVTYLTARYKLDTKEYEWNNYIGPGIGAAIEMRSPGGPQVTLGIEHTLRDYFRSGDDGQVTELFVDWYHSWDIRNMGYPGSTWGKLYWDIPDDGENNTILEGWIRQGVALKRWQSGNTGFMLYPYVLFDYKWDSDNLDWNNYVRPGAGFSVEINNPVGIQVSCGVEYLWENRFRSGRESHVVQLFIRWYAWWDLMKR